MRFGDPETQAILPRLAVALGPILLACARGDLRPVLRDPARDDATHVSSLPALPGAAVAIVLAAAGYPDAPRGGDPIEGLPEAAATGALIFHAGTARDPDGTVRTAGGRVLTVVGRGPDVEAARTAATAAVALIHARGLQHRTDIGSAGADARRPVPAAAMR